MDHLAITDELARNREVFRSLLAGLPEGLYTWRPAPGKWNLLEIVCHLHDEERDDFRARTRSVLEDPDRPLEPIDPVGWVEARGYAQQDFEAMLNNWMDERSASLDWLRSLASPDWTGACLHPKLGRLSAGTFLSNWLAHDYLHIRQIIRLKYQYLQRQTGESLDYAGAW
jgi:hypothetical protein